MHGRWAGVLASVLRSDTTSCVFESDFGYSGSLVVIRFDADLYGLIVGSTKGGTILLRMICRRHLKLKVSGLADCISCTSC